MRLLVARCSARYSGRLNAHLPLATRLVVVKADGSVLLHSDGGSYKPASPTQRVGRRSGAARRESLKERL